MPADFFAGAVDVIVVVGVVLVFAVIIVVFVFVVAVAILPWTHRRNVRVRDQNTAQPHQTF